MNKTVTIIQNSFRGRKFTPILKSFFSVEVKQEIKNVNQRPQLPGLSPEQIDKIAESDKYYRTRHINIEGDLSPEERDMVRRKRMIYRSKQRGWLEADLLMGSWAVKYVPTLSETDLDDYDIMLKEETIDIYNYISGKDELPEHLKNM